MIVSSTIWQSHQQYLAVSSTILASFNLLNFRDFSPVGGDRLASKNGKRGKGTTHTCITMTDIHGTRIRFNQRHVKVAGMIADNTLLHDALVKVAPHPDRAPK